MAAHTGHLQDGISEVTEQTKSHTRHNVTYRDFQNGLCASVPSAVLDQLDIAKVDMDSWSGKITRFSRTPRRQHADIEFHENVFTAVTEKTKSHSRHNYTNQDL